MPQKENAIDMDKTFSHIVENGKTLRYGKFALSRLGKLTTKGCSKLGVTDGTQKELFGGNSKEKNLGVELIIAGYENAEIDLKAVTEAVKLHSETEKAKTPE